MALHPRPKVGHEPPEDSLRSVRRAVVGRWWLQVRLVGDGFQAQANTMSGPPGLWAGPLRDTLADATADAIEAIEFLRQHG